MVVGRHPFISGGTAPQYPDVPLRHVKLPGYGFGVPAFLELPYSIPYRFVGLWLYFIV